MFLTHLHLRSAPGIPHGLQLRDLKPGLILLLGPNASGKSTIGRTLRGGLWPEHAPPDIDARSTWQSSPDGPPFQATTVFERTQWDDASVPLPAPELADIARLNLRELLDATDLDIAKKVQLELDGGYDIAALQLAARPRVRPLPTVSRGYDSAQSALTKALGEADALAQQEARLAGLKQELEHARSAHARMADVERAIQAQKTEETVAKHQHAFDLLADAHPTLTREHVDQLRSATVRLAQAEEELGEVEHQIQTETARVAAHDFPVARPSLEVLANLIERARALHQARAELHALQQDHTAAAEAVRTQSALVWSAPHETQPPEQAALESLQAVVKDLLDAQTALDQHGAPPDLASPAPSTAQLDQLEEARSMLRQWLKTPQPVAIQPTPSRPPAWLHLALIVGAVLVIIGIAAAGLAHAVAGLALVALGLGLVGVWAGSKLSAAEAAPQDDASPSEADILARRYQREGHPSLHTWDVETVSATLTDLERQLSTAREAQRAAEALTRHAAKSDRLSTARDTARDARDEQVIALGLNPDLAGLSLLHQANRLQGLCLAVVEEAAIAARVAAKAATVDTETTAIRTHLEDLHLPDLPLLEDPPNLLPAARTAHQRLETLQSAESLLSERHQHNTRVQRRKEQEADRLSTLLRELQLDDADLDQLPSLLDGANKRRAALSALTDSQRESTILQQGLPSDLPEDLSADLQRLQELSRSADSLARDVAQIEERIRLVTSQGTITDALAQLDAGMESLARDREVQWVAHAGAALKSWLQQERRSHDTPQLLQQARRWFLTFTQLRYELDVSTGGAFVAKDTHTGRLQRLSELSDGTRIQLLLACRLAFLESVEGTEPTPLFLDEVLSTTDPERFSAVAGAVLALCKTGRQVFYATSDPSEVHAWRAAAEQAGATEPQLCTLGGPAVEDAWSPAPSLATEGTALPPVDNHDAISWCVATGLPRPGLHDALEQWPLVLLLPQSLDAVRTAATAGADRVAHLALPDDGVPLPLEEALAHLATVRRDVLDAALAAMRIGRGRPFTWSEVKASGAITATFADRVRALTIPHSEDAKAFLLATKALKRFNEKNVDKLREHLTTIGALDPRSVLRRDEVVLQAQLAAAVHLNAGRLTLKDVQALVDWCADVLQLSWPTP